MNLLQILGVELEEPKPYARNYWEAKQLAEDWCRDMGHSLTQLASEPTRGSYPYWFLSSDCRGVLTVYDLNNIPVLRVEW